MIIKELESKDINEKISQIEKKWTRLEIKWSKTFNKVKEVNNE